MLGQAGATVDLTSAGGINEVAGATLTAATLQSSGGISGAAVDLNGTSNAIGTLGGFAVSGQPLSLSDAGAPGITGAVLASDVTIGGAADSSPTGITLSITGAVSASSVTIGGAAGSTPSGITLSGTGSIVAPVVTLTAGAGGIALNAGAVLGQTGATVNLTSAGGINEDAGATLTAATLQSSGGIGGAAAALNGTSNAIGVLDGFAVSGQALSLSDTGALSIGGAVSASDVTIGGTAGSTPSGITLSGTGSIVAPLVTLAAGAGGIALNAGALLGQTGATVNLTSAGGTNEAAGATLTAATLQSSGGIGGGAADLAGTANAIAGLGNFSVGADALSLSDTGPLGIPGVVSASSVTIGGAAGSTPSGIALSGTGSVVAPMVTLSAGTGGIALDGTSVLGQTGATVDLTSAGGINEAAGATLTAATLQSSGGISGAADLLGTTNAVATLTNVSATQRFDLLDATALTVTGTISAPLIVIDTQGNPLTIADGTTIITGGVPAPNQLTMTAGALPTPDGTGVGAYFTSGTYQQTGPVQVLALDRTSSNLDGGPTILVIDVTGGQNIALDPAPGLPPGLTGPTTWLVLELSTVGTQGSTVTGNVFVKSLTVDYPVGSVPSDFSVVLNGTVNGIAGKAAASQSGAVPLRGASLQFNNCPIGTATCVVLPMAIIPPGNPAQFLAIGMLINPNDNGDLLLPLVSDQDY